MMNWYEILRSTKLRWLASGLWSSRRKLCCVWLVSPIYTCKDNCGELRLLEVAVCRARLNRVERGRRVQLVVVFDCLSRSLPLSPELAILAVM